MSILKKFFAWLRSLFATEAAVAEHALSGWIPDTFDPRDHTSDQVFTLAAALPAAVDLSPGMRPIDQQGVINSCVGNAVTSALETVLKTADLSRLFVYYNARALEGRASQDAGCAIRNAIKSVVTNGVPSEATWPYDTTRYAVAPSAVAVTEAIPLKNRVGYATVTTLAAMKTALATGFPVVFGFSVPDTFVSQTKFNGVLPYPVTGVKYIGAHAVLAVGYDDKRGTVLCRNSFGPEWGNKGYFEMPYQWFASMTGLVSDAWVLSPKA